MEPKEEFNWYRWTNIECLQEQTEGLALTAAGSKEEAIYSISEVFGRTPEEVISIAKALSSIEPEVSEYDAPL